jgi:hypothetical protein
MMVSIKSWRRFEILCLLLARPGLHVLMQIKRADNFVAEQSVENVFERDDAEKLTFRAFDAKVSSNIVAFR